jgi:uncharacterized repeat protein (TIGR03803 family)
MTKLQMEPNLRRVTMKSIRLCVVASFGAACVMTLLAIQPAQANKETATFTTLHSFDSTDGAYPTAGLVEATNGNLYGITGSGGGGGYGTVFEITPSGRVTTLHSFHGTDGANPYVHAPGLVQASDGNFYGTTQAGGAENRGTVFKITPSGTLTTLHNFRDGANPFAGLVQATDGNFYGTTKNGGASGYGTIFKTTPRGALTTLHDFDSHDGANPEAGLVQGTDGNFYGTTAGGGANNDGTVFQLTPSGTLTTLYSFCPGGYPCTDGTNPEAGLVQGTDGNFYGTTAEGGSAACDGGCGTVFKITPSGNLTTLYTFCSQSNCADGVGPEAPLVQATDGNFYGTTLYGPGEDRNSGTVFEITPSGNLTTLYAFCSQSNCTDGYIPYAGLVQATNGNFYGTTTYGGASSACMGVACGTVFKLSVGLSPFAETMPTSGRVGAAVKILATNLTGATSVTFNGTAAVFRVVSKSLITTTVPTGATTGKVKVSTPRGTLKSNVVFRVTK